MDREELEQYIQFHEDKANYYIDWLNEIINEETTIGFKYLKTKEDN
tara:strand:+ start:642 stop:779 length:138 start_codon:yes stop_codon:yes gene_type:complete